MPEQPPPARAKGTLTRTFTAAIACGALAGCPSGPQLRPAPPAAACPEGAEEAMEKLRIPRLVTARFSRETKTATVREGRTRVWVMLDVPSPNPEIVEGWVTGELFVGQRVYGRFTQLETERDGTVPVCLELREFGRHLPFDGVPGVPREPGSTAPDTAIIDAYQQLANASRFK